MEGLQKNNNEIKDQHKTESLNSTLLEQPEVINREIKIETPEEKENLVNLKRNEILEMFDDKNENNNEKKEKIKEGVDFVFEQSPELAQIGTKEQYSEYLDNIFPESKMRDIVYHGSGNKFDAFDKNKQETPGFYFTPDCNSAYFSKNDNIYSVILNTKNPISNFNEIYKIAEKGDINEFIKLGYDSIIELIEKREIIVFEPEQTYILGTTHDLESFKKFVENNQDSQG